MSNHNANLNKEFDLSRWNRSGLSEFQYIDGNAITFLETLRLQLVEEYEKSGKHQWQELLTLFPQKEGESRLQTRKRISQQYYAEPRDYAWEILRTFSRSAHILGQYINAYANEAYLPTAVEWDNVRKLVAMLDYSPTPPASAETYIALLYKEGESGQVNKRFAVKNTPEPGDATAIFETQDDLQGCSDNNAFKLYQWNQNRSTVSINIANHNIRYYLDESSHDKKTLNEFIQDINQGDFGVIAGNSNALPVQVKNINLDSAYLDLKPLMDLGNARFEYYETSLYLQPQFVSSPLANGEASILTKDSLSVSVGEIVFIDTKSGWKARKVIRNEHKHIVLSSIEGIAEKDPIYRARSLNKQSHEKINNNEKVNILPKDIFEYFVDENLNVVTSKPLKKPFEGHSIRYFGNEYKGDLYYPDKSPVGSIEQVEIDDIHFSGKAPELASGDWAMVQNDRGFKACKINSLIKDEQWFTINLQSGKEKVGLLRSAFKKILKHRAHNLNSKTAWDKESSDVSTILKLEKGSNTDSLKLGQKLIVAGEEKAFAVSLNGMTESGGIVSLYVSPSFHKEDSASDFKRHNVTIYGNAVRATHGETQPEKIVGSGDASSIHQQFTLLSDNISWVADAGFSCGVRADVAVYVNQRQWQQVEDLSRSSAEDHHFQILIDEDGKLNLKFGDGKHGRRLPTGIDNIRAIYRNGNGESGNLDAHALVKIAKPNKLIKDFVAPMGSTGGAYKESTESMRENAPATVLTLERAVSLDDFTYLSLQHSMVWQAKAFKKMPDRPGPFLVEVVVVAAGGGVFVQGSETAQLIEGYLKNHSAPGTPVSVISYSPLYMQLKISIMVNRNAYELIRVEQAVAEHLKTHLALKQRKLGQALFRSEIITLLEQVEGVENGHCEILTEPFANLKGKNKPRQHIDSDGMVRKVAISPNQLLYLDTDQYGLQITSQSYEL